MSQAVYFPIRTLYLTLKIEQRERFKTGQELQQQQQQQRGSTDSPGQEQQQQVTGVGAGLHLRRVAGHAVPCPLTAAATTAADGGDGGDKGDRANVEMFQNHAHATRFAPHCPVELGG